MQLELVRENTNAAGGINGRLYVDGVFFAHTLENAAAAIPCGVFPLYYRFSPKFGAFKLSIDVPGRQYIMFHGGNTPDDSAGCVLVAKNLNQDGTIQGDLSAQLFGLAKDETDAGNATLLVRNKTNWPLVVAVVAAAAFFITR